MANTTTQPIKLKIRDVLIGGFPGFTDLTLANTAGEEATGRVGIYLHMSIASAANAAGIHKVLSTLVPHDSSDGVSFTIEAGTNTAFHPGDAYDSFVKTAPMKPDSCILNCGSSDEISTGKSSVESIKSWMNDFWTHCPGTSVAIVVTPSGDDKFLGTDYGTDPHWVNQRSLEIFGRRACDDIPAQYYNQTVWFNHNIAHGKWALDNGIPYDVILSPTAGSNFTSDVQTVCKAYWAAGVYPTRFIIESYTPGIGIGIGMETDDTLNRATLWIAQNKPVLP